MYKFTEYEMHKLDTLITLRINKWKEILEDDELHYNYDESTLSNIKEDVDVYTTILAKLKIISDITGDCDYYAELDYGNWKDLLSDGNTEIDKEEYDNVLYEEFTEEELDKLWKDSHKNYEFEKKV